MTASAFAPGRIHLIGEHTDYNGGLALPFAIELGVTVSAREAPAPDLADPFTRAVATELERFGAPLGPARVEIESNLPSGAGLGSSGAVGVALVLALSSLGDSPQLRRRDVAEVASRAEHALGSRTGLLDQYASLFGEPGKALLIDFSSLSVEPVPVRLGGFRFVFLDSGERRANSDSGYNDRRAECEHGVPSRLRHVASENERVLEAAEAVRTGDMLKLGRLLNASHKSLRDDFEVSTPAIEAARIRLLEAGAIGARLHGGGFGGGVIGVMPRIASLPPGSIEVTPSAGARQNGGSD